MTPQHVLVVDDNPRVLSVVRSTVQVLFSEARCVAVSSGREALDEMGRERFDLVVTDLKLEGVSGIEVARAARERAGSVVVMTGDRDDSTVHDVESLGAHLLTKPFSAGELEALVATLP